jgi:non-heme chloroperoxidase
MFKGNPFIIIAAIILTVLPFVYSQRTKPWSDPSHHSVQFVTVEENIKVEVLDWGGSGRSIVLLAGLGNTAHVFDDFSPKLANNFHVYGITRRGFGSSTAPKSGYSVSRYAEDILKVIDSLNLTAPIIAGHSFGCDELTELGGKHPTRIGALIYLDGELIRSFETPAEYRAVTKMLPPTPQPKPDETSSYAALKEYFVKTGSSILPEAEVRSTYQVSPEGRIGARSLDPEVSKAIMEGIMVPRPAYGKIQAHALALYAVPGSPADLMRNWYSAGDRVLKSNVEKLYGFERERVTRWAQYFRENVAYPRVVEVVGANHHLFISNETDVLREMRFFIAELPH